MTRSRKITNTTPRTNLMLSITVLCWSSMGYILGNKYRRFIFLPPVLILIGTILSFLCFSGANLESLLLNLYFFMLFFNTGVCMSVVMLIETNYISSSTHLHRPFGRKTCRIHKHCLLCVNPLLGGIHSVFGQTDQG